MAAMVGTLGCRSNARYAVERTLPPPVALPEVARLAVVAFVGTGGEAFASAVRRRLERDAAFQLHDLAGVSSEDPAILADVARRAGVDGVLTGRMAVLDVSRVMRAPTLVTKSTPAGPRDLPTERALRTGRLQASFAVVLADGNVRRGRAVSADVRAERVEDPDPRSPTVAPRELPQDPIPSDAEVVAQLVEIGAAALAGEIVPRREPAHVEWEDASGHDEAARAAFVRQDYRGAADHLRAALATPALAPDDRATLLYDLGLCEDLVGDHPRAEQHLDQALALRNSELHQSALRDLRRRDELLRREERR